MAYQALYRKYRPKSFDEVVGQKQIVQTLKNAVQTERIAHAYLFTGPRGTGKTSVAKIFARTLNCTSDNKPCMECENCRLSLNGQHPDIVEIDAASNNGVDEVRSLIDRVGYSPMEGKYKIYIIDEVHMMSAGAFNALLKTIEEPPAHVIFILATTEPNKILPTVLSRCQRFDFSKVPFPDMCRRIEQVCSEENIEIDPEAVRLIASFADGGMRDALSILDQTYAYCSGKILASDIREIYGVVRAEDIGEIYLSLTQEKVDQAMTALEEFQNSGFDQKRFIADFISLLKDSLLCSLSPKTGSVSDERKAVISKYFLQSDIQNRIRMLNELMNIYSKLSYASSVYDYIQTVLLKSVYWNSDRNRTYQSDFIHPAPKNSRQQYDQKSEKSEIGMETRQKSHSASLSDVIFRSDVSRETSASRSDEKSDGHFDSDFLLSLLTGANKEQRKADAKNLNQNLKLYFSSLEFGKSAQALTRAGLIASSDQYVLVQVPTVMEANEINRLQKKNKFDLLTKKLLLSQKMVFAITAQEWTSLKHLFLKRQKENSLPAPHVFDLSKTEKIEKTKTEQLKDIFSNLQVMDD